MTQAIDAQQAVFASVASQPIREAAATESTLAVRGPETETIQSAEYRGHPHVVGEYTPLQSPSANAFDHMGAGAEFNLRKRQYAMDNNGAGALANLLV